MILLPVFKEDLTQVNPKFDGISHVLHTIPSGIFHPRINLIGNGVVIDPVIFKGELDKLAGLKLIFLKIIRL